MPGFLACAVFAIEAGAGVALIPGVQPRLFAALAIPVLLGATWAHLPSGWLFTSNGGGWEYPLFLSSMAFVQMGLGNGMYALPFKTVKLQSAQAQRYTSQSD